MHALHLTSGRHAPLSTYSQWQTVLVPSCGAPTPRLLRRWRPLWAFTKTGGSWGRSSTTSMCSPECPLGAAAGLRSKVRSWEHTLTFGHELAVRFLIDFEAWHLLEGVCLQRWVTSRGSPWQRALCNALLGQKGADVELRELYHGCGRIPHEAVPGVRAALCIRGGATLRVGETTIHMPRGKGVAMDLHWLAGRQRDAGVPPRELGWHVRTTDPHPSYPMVRSGVPQVGSMPPSRAAPRGRAG